MPKRYAKDPIIEAVAEFRFLPGEPWDGSEPGRLSERAKEQFPKREAGFSLERETTESATEFTQRISPQPHLRLTSTDGASFIQIAPHVLSIHSLHPYMGWEELLPLIEKTIAYYREIAAPSGISRAGLRYINRIEIPGTVEMEDYFDLYPHRGPGLPTDYALVRALLHFSYDDGSDILRAQVGDVASSKPDTVAFDLDLDYFTARGNRLSWETLVGWLNQAHDRLNAAFEGSIKQPLRDQFSEVSEQ